MTETAIVPITYAEVINAARALESEGIRVTILAIRERIGRGSFSTVKKFLERWNEERDLGNPAARSAPVPASLESLWLEACKRAEETVAGERLTLDQLTSELEQRFEQQRAEVTASDTRRMQAEQRLADLQTALERSHADVDELKRQRTDLEQRLYGVLELAAQERHAYLVSAEKLHQIGEQVQAFSVSQQQHHSMWTTLLQLAEHAPVELRELERRLLEAAASDRQRLIEQNEYWRQALTPLSTIASNIETVLRTVRQRTRPIVDRSVRGRAPVRTARHRQR